VAAAIEVADTEVRDIVIETARCAVFTNRGAALRGWRPTLQGQGQAVDLVPQRCHAPKPFEIETGNPAIDARASAALFRADGGGAAWPAEGVSRRFSAGDRRPASSCSW
jgi:hypothetical protein